MADFDFMDKPSSEVRCFCVTEYVPTFTYLCLFVTYFGSYSKLCLTKEEVRQESFR